MGHGLVSIPRRIWGASSVEASIQGVERNAVTAWESKADAEEKVADITGEIAALERACEGRDDTLANWVRELAIRNPDAGERRSSTEEVTLNEEYLSSLTRRARVARNQLLKAQTNWTRLLKRAGYLYDLKAAAGSAGKTIEWKSSSPGRVCRIMPRSLQYMWFLALLPWLSKGLAIVAGLVSVSIVWSEIVHNWTSPLLSLVGIVIRSTGWNWFLLEVPSTMALLMSDLIHFGSVVHDICYIFKLYASEDFEHV